MPNNWLIALVTILISGILNSIGGYSWHNSRRFIMPLVLSVYASYATHMWWVGLMVLPVISTLLLGYSRFGSGNFSRAIWLGVQALNIGLGLSISGHLSWFFYIPYVLLACVLGGLYVNWKQIYGDFIAGCYLASILLFIH